MRVIIYANGTDGTDVTAFVETLTWSGDYQACARTLEFSLVSSYTDKTIASVRCELMDLVVFYDDDRIKRFEGYIWSRTKSTDGNSIDVTCYDMGYYLKRNKASYKFSNMTPDAITRRICADYGVGVGDIETPGLKISRNFLGVTLQKIIMTCYTLASEKNGLTYQMIFDGRNLNVIRRGIVDGNTVIIEGGSNLMDATITESAEKMVTRVKIYNKDDEFVRNVDNSDAIKAYGVLQEYLKQTSDDNKVKAAEKQLADNGLSQKITVNCLGDTRCITGRTVVVREPYTGIYGLFYIDADTHTWKNNQYFNKLTLNFKNIMDEQDAGSVEKMSAGGSSSAKSTKKSVTNTTDENSERPYYRYNPDGTERERPKEL